MSKVVYPGSFDPITLGHLDIIKRASKQFDEVVVCILNNSSKKSSLFSINERVNILTSVICEYSNVYVKSYGGLLVDFAKENDISIIIRGLREVTDFANELTMAQANRIMAPDIETVFLATNPKYSYISSSIVREFASYGRSVEGLVPEGVAELVAEKYK